MRYVGLIWSDVRRHKVRSLFTVLSIAVAFFLFALLVALRTGFEMGVDITGADRLITIHKVSLIQPLPVRYAQRIAAVDGVVDVAHGTWFGGVYQDPRNFFAQIAVDTDAFLRIYPDYVLAPAERDAWRADRTGAVAGRALAQRFGWKVGDRIPIQATIWQRKDGSPTWEFTLDGIYDPAEKGVDDTQFFFHYAYLDEARARGEGLVGWFWERIADPERAPAVAAAIDDAFANSSAETKTATEKAFVQAFARQIGDIGAIVTGILAAVFFTILLVSANTLAQSVRERTAELAVLKTLGFSDLRVAALVLAESLVYAALGGGAGLALGWAFVSRGDPTGGLLPAFYLPAGALALGLALVAAVGLVAGLLPAFEARRLPIAAALRRA